MSPLPMRHALSGMHNVFWRMDVPRVGLNAYCACCVAYMHAKIVLRPAVHVRSQVWHGASSAGTTCCFT